MKHLKTLPLLLLLLIAASAEAHEGRNCLEQAARLDGLERTVFLKGCLASASAPTNTQEAVQQNKRLRCQQYAKNLALQGDERAGYIKACIGKNEAAEVAAARRAASSAAAAAPATPPAPDSSASAKPLDEHSCLDQSKKLDAQDRAAYLKACLAWARSPANVQEAALKAKQLRCEQNAKNLALAGSEKAGYINSCLNRNEAAEKKAVVSHAPAEIASNSAMDSDHR